MIDRFSALRRYFFREMVADYDVEVCRNGDGPMVLSLQQARIFWAMAGRRAKGVRS